VVADLVSRLGPATIIVAGFLGLSYFLYEKINVAEAEAQKQLVLNTAKMGDMSAQLIDNINEMLELNKNVALERAAARKLYETEFANVQADLETARKELDDTLQQSKKTREETDLGLGVLADREATMAVQMDELKEERRSLEAQLIQLNNEREGLASQLAELTSQLGKLKDSATAVAATTATGNDIAAGEPVALPLRQILEAFAADPDSQETRDALKNLAGQRYESLVAAIRKDGIGFDVWFYAKEVKVDRRTVWGYLTQEPDGPRNFVRLAVVDDRITSTTYRQANVLSKIPKAENWYESWMCDLVVVDDDNLSDFYSEEDILQWDQLSLLEQRYPDRRYENGILNGEMMSFEVVSLDGFRSAFPDHYAKWKTRTDAFGRPSVILAMIERAKDFDASNLAGMSSGAFQDGLAEATAGLLEAAVNKNEEELRRVAPGFGRGELGAIAAMALHGQARITDVRPVPSVLQQKAEPEELFEVIFSLEDKRNRRRTPREGRLVFARSGGGWELREFRSPF
jgi:hypothetical protein